MQSIRKPLKQYAVHFYGGSLDFNILEIPSLKILEAFKQRSIVASDDGILPAEVAVPLHITENSYVVLYLCSKTVWINKEDGEAIQGLWRFIRAIEMETEMVKKDCKLRSDNIRYKYIRKGVLA